MIPLSRYLAKLVWETTNTSSPTARCLIERHRDDDLQGSLNFSLSLFEYLYFFFDESFHIFFGAVPKNMLKLSIWSS